MEIRLAKNAGFCFGVKNAMATIEENINTKNMYTLGPVIHNKDVTDALIKKGVYPVDKISNLRVGDTAIIRSHGEPKSTYLYAADHGIKIIDVTCPFVKKIHEIAAQASQNGRKLVIVGQVEHAEVLGIAGWANDTTVIETEEDAKRFIANNPKETPITVVAQTTQKEKTYKSFCSLLSDYFTDIDIYDTICSTTKNRQDEAIKMAKAGDVVVVIGGNHSANTQKLYELCSKYCDRTFKIERAAELALENIKQGDIINIVAGASTPDWLIREVIEIMTQLNGDSEINCSNVEKENEEITAQEEQVQVAENSTQDENESTVPVSEEPTEEIATEEIAAIEETVKPVESETLEAVEEINVSEEPTVETFATDDADFIADYEKTFTPLKTGMIVKGIVVQVTDNEACLNIGYKSDGIINKKEFGIKDEESLKDKIKVGDEIEAEIVKLNDGEGNVLLSRSKMLADESWNTFAAIMQEKPEIECVGKEAVKGGLITFIEGYRVFIPASLLDTKYVEDINAFVGKPIKIKIVEMDRAKKRAIGSRKDVMIAEELKKKEQIWDTLNEGDIVKGKVLRLTDFGVFVDIGGVDGMIHVSDLAWFRVNRPSDIVSIGQNVEVKIISIDKEKNKIGLSLKHLSKKPWDTAEEKYPVGSITTGTVARIAPFGAFIELEQGIDGLLHISQIALNRINKVEEELKIGDVVTVKVIEVDGAKKRISLSRKELLKKDEEAKHPKVVIEEDEMDYVIPPIEGNAVTIGDILRQQEEDKK